VKVQKYWWEEYRGDSGRRCLRGGTQGNRPEVSEKEANYLKWFLYENENI
jgi:hypothetical protein